MLVCTRFQLLAAVILVSAASNAMHAADLKLPVPENWRTEDTTYPPPWARDLPWKGTIQLRFPPGFFKADDDFFWSYPILYQLQGDAIKGVNALNRALSSYDAGLYGGQFEKAKIRLEIMKVKSNVRGYSRQHVTLKGFDPFVTKKPLTTYLDIYRRYNKESDKTVVLILRSPHPIADQDADKNAVRKQLDEFLGVIRK